MEIAQGSRSNGVIAASLEKLNGKVMKVFYKVKKIGEDDPRRILHSVKVGLALTLTSILYYVNPLFDGFKTSAILAVLTVAVVMEFTVGGTIDKGLNRAFATFIAGSLGLGAHYVAALAGNKGEPILLGLFVFLLASAATFSRFLPEIKARYDYGVTVFLSTFVLVAVSGYRVEELVQMAQQRLLTISIGVITCILTSIIVFPNWAGEDLQKLVAANLDKLASFLEGAGAEYLDKDVASVNLACRSFLQAYKSVLNSKPTEDSLANFARWEPAHGRFSFRHPWRMYLKIAALSRQCASSMETLTTYINVPDKTQTPIDEEYSRTIRSACADMSCESAMALSDLALSIRNMTSPAAATLHVSNALATAADIHFTCYAITLRGEHAAVDDILRSATAASLLAQIVKCTHRIVGAVEELARTAQFYMVECEPEPKPESIHEAAGKKVDDGECPSPPPHVAIDIE